MINRDDYKSRTGKPDYISISPAAPGLIWRAVLVHRLNPVENGGNHHIYVDLLDAEGNFFTQTRVRLAFDWDGRRPDETNPSIAFDKQPPEPLANLPIWQGQNTSIWIQDELPSDMVVGLHTNFPDEGRGNTRFHFSHYVIFQLKDVGPVSSSDKDGLRNAILDHMDAITLLVDQLCDGS